MSRSKWKGIYVHSEFIGQKKIENLQKVWIISRSSEIIPAFLGLTFKVYNGKSHVEIVVTDEMIGHKFGEFVYTRAKFEFKKKNKKK
jgi:ribosomal protein S19